MSYKGVSILARLEINYLSETIGMHQSLTVILPDDRSYVQPNAQPKLFPSLLLLHGLSSDHTAYTRFTSIERYANMHQLAVIMPNADHSFYTNMVYGHSYYDYILEVWDYVHQILPLSKAREDNFIAGHSMGGYGTIKFALKAGERFAKAAPLSAAVDVKTLAHYTFPDFKPKAIAGEVSEVVGTPFDPYYLVDEAVNKQKQIPEFLMMCGTEDFLYQSNVDFVYYLQQKGICCDFKDGIGQHDYAYWDKAIQTVIETFMKDHHTREMA